jgi:DNA (cytosine-5)-methyltransferase 1
MMRHGSLFSGIGGFDLAAEWMGWENVFHCEWNEFGQKILKHYWPNAKSYGDIKTLSIESIWERFVHDVKKRYALQIDHTASLATPNKCRSGETITENVRYEILESGIEERKLKSLPITEGYVFAVENLKWNFSQSTTKTIMGMQKGESINLRHGNLLLNVDSLMTTKSSVTTAIMQNIITEFVRIIKNHDVDIITGGVPCQPASTAGKRKGKADDRWLWPEAFRIIKQFQPTWFVFENVRGLISLERGMVFDTLLSEMEALGYEVTPFLLPACAINAPHRRDRIWFIAHTSSSGFTGRNEFKEGQQYDGRRQARSEPSPFVSTRITPHPGLQRSTEPEQQSMGIEQPCEGGATTDTESLRINRTPEHENNSGQSGERGRCDINDISEVSGGGFTTNSPNIGQEQSGSTRNGRAGFEDGDSDANVTNTNSGQRSERGLHEERPGEAKRHVSTRNALNYKRDTWQDFPTQPPVCGRDDGLSSRLAGITFSKHRNESIKGYGNAVVPPLVYEIFKAIQQFETTIK